MISKDLYINPTTKITVGGNRPLSQEIATRERVNFASLGMWLPNPDPILRKTGLALPIYREILRDPHVRGCVKSRKAGVLQLSSGLDRGKTKSRPATIIENLFARLDMPRIIGDILDACQFGYAPIEIVWEQRDGAWLPQRIEGKQPEWFIYDANNVPKLLSKESGFAGEPLEPYHFVIAHQEETYENPYGFPDLSCCFWPVTFKKGGKSFWSTFCEKYGQVFLFGKTPRGSSDQENNKVLSMLDKMIADGVGVYPSDSSVEIVEAAGKSASADLFERFILDCNNEITITQLGHQGAAQSTAGKLGEGKTAETVREDIVNADKRIVEKTVNEIIGLIWSFNWNGDTDRPVWSMYEEEEVGKEQAEVDALLADKCGLKFNKEYFSRVYGYPIEEFEIGEPNTRLTITDALGRPALPGAPGAGADPGTAQFSAPTTETLHDAPLSPSGKKGTSPAEAITAAFTDSELQDQIEPMIQPILDLVAKSSSFDEVMEGMVKLFPKMDTTKLQDALDRAGFAAMTYGGMTANNV